MVEKLKFGSLYMDGQPKEVGGWYPSNEPALRLGNTVPGKEITWIKSGDIYIAEQCLINFISFNNIARWGYTEPVKMNIDGRLATIRLLNVGEWKGAPNEWDDALNRVGDERSLWNGGKKDEWDSGLAFFGAKKSKSSPLIVRGEYGQPRSFHVVGRGFLISGPDDASPSIGWRPALEFRVDRDAVPGDQLCIKLRHSWVRGVLLEKTNYDLILKAIPETPFELLKAEGCLLLDHEKGLAAVERQAIMDIQIEEE